MIPFLFQCVSCRGPAGKDAFPLCQDCWGHLREAPPLCPGCGSPACGPASRCLHLSEAGESERAIGSFTARYLLFEPGYQVLRKWKVRGGPVFDRRILGKDPGYFKALRARPELGSARAVVPLPQKWSRSWHLGRSPAQVIARWLAHGLDLPLLHALELRSDSHRARRQAELKAEERMESRFGFQKNATIALEPFRENVILVDDFMTTGHTLRAGARCLQSIGARRVQAFSLGVRPRRIASRTA